MAFDFTVRTKQDLIDAVRTFGIVPFFRNSIPGFSLEEHVVPSAWYTSESAEWPAWEWKGPAILEANCAYGKFFEKKAAFVSPEWFRELANYRRDGYDLTPGTTMGSPRGRTRTCSTLSMPTPRCCPAP